MYMCKLSIYNFRISAQLLPAGAGSKRNMHMLYIHTTTHEILFWSLSLMVHSLIKKLKQITKLSLAYFYNASSKCQCTLNNHICLS